MKRGIAICFLIAVAVPALAQRPRGRQRPDLAFYYDYGQLIYIDAVNVAADDRNQSRVIVNFRVAYDALTFQKPTFQAAGAAAFSAVLSVRADLLDSGDVTVQRAAHSDTVQVATFAATNDKFRYVVGALSFDAPPGNYTLALVAEDGTSRQTIHELRPHILLRDFRKPLQVSMPLLLADGNYTHPLGLGGNAEFGTPFVIHCDAACDSGIPTVRYALERVHEKDTLVVSQGAMIVAPGTRLSVNDGLCCTAAHVDEPWRFACRARIDGDSLEEGEYILHVHATAGHDTCSMTKHFRTIWSTMPLSLTDLDYAIESMRYILTDGALDSMRDGNADERRKHFDAYWAAQDPTPGTMFNERKTEYFRRVDYAYFTFRNASREEDDGARTDLGKVYILFGRPTSVDRELLPSGPAQEIWTYTNNVRKRFVFVDADKSGVYRLTEVSDIQ